MAVPPQGEQNAKARDVETTSQAPKEGKHGFTQLESRFAVTHGRFQGVGSRDLVSQSGVCGGARTSSLP